MTHSTCRGKPASHHTYSPFISTVIVSSNTLPFSVVTRHVNLAPFSSVASGVRRSSRDFPPSLLSSTGSPLPTPNSIHVRLLTLRMVVQLIFLLKPTMMGDSWPTISMARCKNNNKAGAHIHTRTNQKNQHEHWVTFAQTMSLTISYSS